jgi:signal transduction histidine kinase
MGESRTLTSDAFPPPEVHPTSRELDEARAQHAATAEILRVISNSPGDAQPVFEAIVRNAVALCGSLFANVFRFDGEMLHFVASENTNPSYVELLKAKYPMRPDATQVSGRVLLRKSVIRIENVLADPSYDQRFPPAMGWRRMLGVPMLRESDPLGVIVVAWTEPGPIPKAQEQLLRSFADQAVIAIGNVRLFEEVQARNRELAESLEQQIATSGILRAIASSPTDIQPVLNAVTESSAHLCRAYDSVLFLKRGDALAVAAHWGAIPVDFAELPIDRGVVTGRAVIDRMPVHVHDLADAGDDLAPGREYARRLGFRTILSTPLMREGEAIGALMIRRNEVRPFSDKQIDLLATFADQAVIAIENAHLFKQVQERTAELTRSLEDLRSAQDRLVQTEKLASLGQLTAGIAHEIKNPLNFVNNFSGLSAELVTELREILAKAPLDEKTRGEVDDLADTLKGNLEKVVQHGKRADSIVKNMLLHSRQGSGNHRAADINAIVEESLNLAYHGARAERQDFNVTLERSLDPEAGEVDLYPQEITRVLLNLVSNGFYATTTRKEEADGSTYEPMLVASTRSLGDSVEIRIRDNGTGIPSEVREKLFNPFFTTKPAGEGTGLGLSISHDIVVKQHAGTIEVETEPGAFTEFRIVLPRDAAARGEQRGHG